MHDMSIVIALCLGRGEICRYSVQSLAGCGGTTEDSGVMFYFGIHPVLLSGNFYYLVHLCFGSTSIFDSNNSQFIYENDYIFFYQLRSVIEKCKSQCDCGGYCFRVGKMQCRVTWKNAMRLQEWAYK